MKTWMIGLGGLAVGGVLGFVVGAMPLYLQIHANGGPLKGPVEGLERRASMLAHPGTPIPRTASEVQQEEVALAGLELTHVALTYCEMSPELQRRAVSVTAKLAPALAAGGLMHSSESAALQYLMEAGERTSCAPFKDPNMQVVQVAPK